MAVNRPEEVVVTKGFRIEITGADGGKGVDNAWETCTGGALCIEVAPASIGSGQGREATPLPIGADPTQPATPLPKSVSEITLRGPMTASRKWIAQNINDTVKGKFTRFDLTVIEINKDGSDGKSYTYVKCFLTRYVYPVLSADGTGNLYEEVSLKPERLELR